MLESGVKAKVREIFKRHDVAYAHVPGSQFGKAGVGDYICCVAGIYLEVEVKTTKGKMSELQKIRGKAIEEAGGIYLVVNETNLNILEKEIESIIRHNSLRSPTLYTAPLYR